MSGPERRPGLFNPSDPYDASCEWFRLLLTNALMAADASLPSFRDLDESGRLNAFSAGSLTGLVGILLACTPEETWDQVMDGLAKGIPFARKQAIDIMNSADVRPS